MRPVSRRPERHRRRLLPPQSRLTVSRAVAALRRGREALTDIEGQLGHLLAALADPAARLDAAAPERLADTARDAMAALSSLSEIRRLLPSHR